MEYKTLGTVATYINGRAFKPSEWEASGKPIIRIQNLTNDSAPYNFTTREYENKYLVHNGDLLFAWSASLGAHIWKGKDAWLNQHIFRVLPNDGICRDYLYYFLLNVVAELYSKTHGSGMVHITKRPFMNTPIPIPSIKRQQFIVARIEELFSQLDSGVQTLKKVKEQLAAYRQAVMKDAFESVKKDCTVYNVEDVCKEIKVGIVIKPAQYYTTEDKGIRAFRSANVREFQINNNDWVYLSNEGNELNKRSQVHTGDVLVVRSGYPGTACVVTPDFDGCNAIDILIAVPDQEKILPEYLCAYTNSPLGKAIVHEKKRGVGQKHFNVSGYSKTPIIVPPIEKQKKIVAFIESKLSVCNNIAQITDQALQQAEAMRKSILKQAFEGGL